jgi:hypothetical protein
VIFIFEMLIKLYAFGVVGYFRDKWNWIDCLVTCEGIVSIALDLTHLFDPDNKAVKNGDISILSGFRALRPLRTAQYMPPMRLLVQTLIKSIPESGSIVLVIAMAVFIFAIMGQVLFQNQLRSVSQRPCFITLVTCMFLVGVHAMTA